MTDGPKQPLDAWLDGELSPADAARVVASLSTDDAAYVAAVREQGDRLRTAPLPLPSADAHLRWLNQWQIARDRSMRRLAGWMTAAAAVVLGVTLSGTFVGPAVAGPVLAEWETAAVGSAEDEEVPRTARLIAIDLALPTPAKGTSR